MDSRESETRGFVRDSLADFNCHTGYKSYKAWIWHSMGPALKQTLEPAAKRLLKTLSQPNTTTLSP
jgi:hypothetical protein